MNAPDAPAMDLLRACGADQAPHSGRTLMDHLLGTRALLQAWGNSPNVCLGGLFHSIYGTNAFRRQSLGVADRARLCDLIGAEAEALTWAFCGIERPRAIVQAVRGGIPACQTVLPHRLDPAGPALELAPARVCELAELECANLVEQRDDSPALRELYCAAVSYPGVLSTKASCALRHCLSEQLAKRSGSAKAAAR